MSTYFLVAMLVLIAFQPNLPRLLGGVFLLLAFALFGLLDPYLSDVSYYATAGAIDLLLVYVLGAISPITITAIRLQRACFASLLVNAAGFLLWWAYIDPLYYNSAMWVVHAYIVLTMLRVGGHGGTTDRCNGRAVRFTYRPRLLTMQNYETTL